MVIIYIHSPMLYYRSVNNFEFRLRWFFVGVTGGKVVFQFGKVCAVEVIAKLVEFSHYVDVCQWVFVTGELAQCQDIILAEYCRNNYAGLVGAHKFSVHHHAGDASVTVVERVDFANHEHHEDGPRKWIC